MLSPSGAEKNSGKIVTMSILTRAAQSGGAMTIRRAGEVEPCHDLRAERDEHTALLAPNVEHHALWQLVHVGHFTDHLVGSVEHDAQSGEVVQIDLVLAERGELVHWREQIAFAPALGFVPIGDPNEGDDPAAALEGTTLFDDELALVGGRVAAHGTGKYTTAGREYRVRRVGQRLDDELAVNAVCPADAPDDREIGRSHVTRRRRRWSLRAPEQRRS